MPEKARVLLVDDEDLMREMVRDFLKSAGHVVVLEAATMLQAEAALNNLDKVGINVAILDGNLTKDDKSGDDGARIADAIRARFPSVRILGLSFMHYAWGDQMFSKSSIFTGGNPLGDAVTAL